MLTLTTVVLLSVISADAPPAIPDEHLQTMLRDLGSDENQEHGKAVGFFFELVNGNRLTDEGQLDQVVSRLNELLQVEEASRQADAALWLHFVALKQPRACRVCVPALLKLIDDDGSRGCEAISTLAAIGPGAEAAIPKLRELCQRENEFIQPRAAAALANIQPGNEEGVLLLIKWLQTGSLLMRRCAALGLETCAPNAKSAVAALRTALKDENAAVRVMAANALWKVAPDPDEVIPIFVQSLSEEVFVKPFSPSSWRPDHRITAALALGRLEAKAEPAIPALDAALTDKDTTLRWAATKSLGRIGKPALKSLRKALKDESPYVRQAANDALGRLEPDVRK